MALTWHDIRLTTADDASGLLMLAPSLALSGTACETASREMILWCELLGVTPVIDDSTLVVTERFRIIKLEQQRTDAGTSRCRERAHPRRSVHWKAVQEVDAVNEASFCMRATISSCTVSVGRSPLTVNIHSRPA